MKALLRIFYFFMILIVLLLLTGLFLPEKVHVESSVTVNANPEIVFDQVNNLRNWTNWSPWAKEDSTMKITFGDKVKGLGASYSWTSLHSGDGSVVISKSDANTELETELEFHTAEKSFSSWKFEKEGKLTKVTWAYDNSRLNYLERYFVVFFHKNMLKSLQKGLDALKQSSEVLRLSRVSQVSVISVPERAVMTIQDSANTKEFLNAVEKTTNRVEAYLGRRQIDTVGKNFTIIHNWQDTGNIVFRCALPIPSKTWGWKEYQCMTEPATKAVTLTHFGDFNSKKAFRVLNEYAKKNSLEVNGAPWVEYFTNPDTEQDTSIWKMQVYLPVE